MTPAESRTDVEVEGRTISLSNLDKVMFPGTGLTKAGVVDYYRRVAPAMLPHLAGRAVTLVRFPDGADRPGFFEKNCPDHRPPWVRTAEISSRSRGETITHCVVGDLPTLVWLANLAALELHAPMAVASDPDHPRAVVFDLDPGAPAGLRDSCAIGLALRELLGRLDLVCFPKTSGKKGLHVYVPLNPRRGRGAGQEQARDFAHAVAQLLARRQPGEVVTSMAKKDRPGKVFVDWSQNARHKTTVAAYSLRAAASPNVSTPVRWEEVEAVAEGADPDTLRFGPEAVIERVESDGDLFQPVGGEVQDLPERGTKVPE